VNAPAPAPLWPEALAAPRPSFVLLPDRFALALIAAAARGDFRGEAYRAIGARELARLERSSDARAARADRRGQLWLALGPVARSYPSLPQLRFRRARRLGTAPFASPAPSPAGERASPAEKHKAPGIEAFANDSEGFDKSGRQDSNLRPLGPEPSALPG
jgi:hypothetical protein